MFISGSPRGIRLVRGDLEVVVLCKVGETPSEIEEQVRFSTSGSNIRMIHPAEDVKGPSSEDVKPLSTSGVPRCGGDVFDTICADDVFNKSSSTTLTSMANTLVAIIPVANNITKRGTFMI